MPSSVRPWIWPAYQQRLKHSKQPILVGPFRGEVGFEVLYWIPWLQRLAARLKIAPGRIIPVTRGGAAVWYSAPRHVELFALRTPHQVRLENMLEAQRTGWGKQFSPTPFDTAVLKEAEQQIGEKCLTLHPSWMYHDLQPFWSNRTGQSWLFDRTSYGQLSVPKIEGLTLPEAFTAVRFYLRPTFPPALKDFAKETIRTLSALSPVILLTSGSQVDDHVDILPELPNVHKLTDLTGPIQVDQNLAVQSAILARADGFVGTYGGMAQLALRLGKPVVCFYDSWHSTSIAHRQLSDTLAMQNKQPFHVLQVNALALLQQVCPRVKITLDVVAQQTEPALQ